MRRRTLQVFGGLLVLFFVVAVRVLLGAHSELAAGVALADAGDDEGAILQWRRAAKWHVPGSPYGAEAIAHLERLAGERESAGDLTTALSAWRAIHSAALAARSFYVPYSDARGRADEAIARLTTGGGGERARLSALTAPAGVGWPFLLTIAAFWALVASLLLLASRGFDEEDRIVAGPARRYALVSALSVACLILGLMSA